MTELATFNDFLINMAEIDFFTTILPFVLTYVIVFIALGKQEMPLFGKEGDKDPNKKFRSVIAIIFGFFVAYYIGMNPVYQGFFSSFLARILIGIIGLIGLIVFLAYIPGFQWENANHKIYLIIGVIFAVFSAFTLSDGLNAFLPEYSIDLGIGVQEVLSATFESGLIYLLIIGLALWWVTSTDEEQDDGG